MSPELDKALTNQEFDKAKALILKQAERSRTVVGLPKNSELSPLEVAAFHHPDAAKRMLELGLAPNLHVACALGLTSTVKDLVTKSPELLDIELEGMPPLGIGILKGQMDTVKVLLEMGENPNKPFKRIGWFVWEIKAMHKGFTGWYPVHMAAIHGYQEPMGHILKTLIESGADPTLTSPLGMNALHLATTPNWTHHVELLLNLGVSIDSTTTPLDDEMHRLSGTPVRNIPHANELTPLMVAIKEGHIETISFLLNHGANIQATDSNGWTPLHHAAWPWWKENKEIVVILIERGATLGAKASNGKTPVDLAKEAKNTETFELLQASL